MWAWFMVGGVLLSFLHCYFTKYIMTGKMKLDIRDCLVERENNVFVLHGLYYYCIKIFANYSSFTVLCCLCCRD